MAIQRVLLLGADAPAQRPGVEAAGLHVVGSGSEADAALCFGGDGTLIGAEREFPGLPKVPIRPDRVCVKCSRHEDTALYGRVRSGTSPRTLLPKLEATKGNIRLLAINDIVLHNALVTSAVRYRVRIDGAPYSGVIVGDGLVLSTPFGSTAYYKSITHSVFRVGIGLAFNNSTELVNHLVLDDSAVVEAHITRGPALLVADNVREPIALHEGDTIVLRKAAEIATILELDTLTCLDCRLKNSGRPAGHLHVR